MAASSTSSVRSFGSLASPLSPDSRSLIHAIVAVPTCDPLWTGRNGARPFWPGRRWIHSRWLGPQGSRDVARCEGEGNNGHNGTVGPNRRSDAAPAGVPGELDHAAMEPSANRRSDRTAAPAVRRSTAPQWSRRRTNGVTSCSSNPVALTLCRNGAVGEPTE
jgi:hypothetical protein